MIYTIIGYFLLPFYAIYCWIRNSTKDMSDGQVALFYFMLLIIGMLLYELLK